MGLSSRLLFRPARRMHSSRIIGLMRESKNLWECRVPLTPGNIKNMKSKYGSELEFHIQPSRKRVFSDDEYSKVGALITSDLKDCNLIMGVKEVSRDHLLPNKSYIFFSHTHKGQPQNRPLLNDICSKGITLYDYELIKDEYGKRLVSFGRFAGIAGMLNAMNGLGSVLLRKGIRSPFLHVPLAHHFRNLDHVKESMSSLSQEISSKGLNQSIAPIVFTFTGKGNVSKGAQEVFNLLPHEWIDAKDLKFADYFRNDIVYGCSVEAKDYLKRSDGGMFDYKEYLNTPELYQSHFHESIAPFSTVLVNGIYWEKKYPRLLTKSQLGSLTKLMAIADISCDIEGSIEFMNKASTIDDPFYYYNYEKDSYSSKQSDPNAEVQIMSIDNLPAQLPEDSSKHFGNQLEKLIPALVGLEKTEIVDKCKITDRGHLVKQFEHLKVNNIRRVLILGSGYVVPPVVDFFKDKPDVRVKIGTNTPDEAMRTFENTGIIGLDVSKDSNKLDELIQDADIVISLVSADLHVPITEACIKNKKNMVTASYISPALQALSSKAEAAEILILNEIGFDPGLDHLAAMQVIEGCKGRGEVVESFVSWCGGLPSPELAASNPFGYKFSWSPRGVLLATQNSAQYLENGQIIHVKGEDLLKSVKIVDNLHPALQFEGIPNRDSIKYKTLYGLSDELKTIFRGTLRYKGFCELMQEFKELGFMSQEPNKKMNFASWSEFTEYVLKQSGMQARNYQVMEWLGLFDTKSVNLNFKSNLDGFCRILQEKLQYCKDERDMAFLHHEFIVFNPQTGERKRIQVRLCEFGNENGSAMARMVGIPVAIAAWKILEGEIIGETGVKAPLTPAIYNPILKSLPISFQTTTINTA